MSHRSNSILNLIISSLYHFHGLLRNTTTIEGWEKDKVATMVRKGKIHEVSTCLLYLCFRLMNLSLIDQVSICMTSTSSPSGPYSIHYIFQNLGRRKNIESVLGNDWVLWCWPTIPPGTGLKYEIAEGDGGKWIELSARGQLSRQDREMV